MSDLSQGPGWWVASDGKWYPPESGAPTIRSSMPPLPSGTDAPQGPGWWQASDGKWYPPQAPFSGAAEVKKPVYKRAWFWILIVVALVFAGCVTTVSIAGVAVDHIAHEKHTIVYSVTGTGQGTTINYATLQEGSGQNGNAQVTTAVLPWSKTITASGLITIYHVTALVGPAGGTVTCTITDNGSEVASRTATGALQSADCNWGG